MNAQPLVSIIIVNYNGLKFLDDCLDSLKKVNFKNFEIILVDNNSSDGSPNFVRNNFPYITIIDLENNYGFAKPNNVGVQKAKGEFLLFLNNDTKVTPNFIDELLDMMQQNSSVAICQSMLLKPNGEVDSSGDYIDSIGIPYSSHQKVTQVSEIFSAKGASMLVRKSIFEELGGFDEKFFVSFEDVDFGWRARILGYKIILVPSSIVYHLGSQTIKKIDGIMAFHGFKNQLAMKITNFETNEMIKSLILFFVKYGIRSFRVWLDYLFRGKTVITATKYENKISNKPSYRSIFKGIMWNLKNIRYLAQKRKTVNSQRKVSSKEILKLNPP